MPEFVSPNWHVVLIHYPLALVMLGVLIELLTVRNPHGSLRRGGRWMILFGALLSLPAATAGIYAFRDVVTPEAIDTDQPWPTVAQKSTWSVEQWDLMQEHIWYNSAGAVLLALLVCVHLGISNEWRRRLYWPLLISLLIAAGLFAAGAWHGGETVYRHGTGVERDVAESTSHGITYYVPPLEAHVVVAGFVVAAIVLALGLTLRRWQVHRAIVVAEPPVQSRFAPEGQPLPEIQSEVQRQPVCSPPYVAAGRFWILADMVALLTAVLGMWAMAGGFALPALQGAIREVTEAGHTRLLAHVICGVAIVILPFILTCLVRFAPSQRGLTGFLVGLLVLLAAFQIWLGVAMLFDSHRGPLFGFNPTAPAPHEHTSRAKGELE